MNPFDLTGASFLGFYVLVGIAVVWTLRLWLRHQETANATPAQNITDPYLIAHLRAGDNEALRVATVALLDRSLLVADGEKLKAKNTKAFGSVSRPIEKAILQHYRDAGEGHEIFNDVAAKQACADYSKVLKDQGLLADTRTYTARFAPVMIALVVLIAVTWIKITIAFAAGRHNVGFLVVLTIFFGIIVLATWFRRHTGRGDAMLADLRSLFSRLKDRAKSLRAGGQTNEAALLAAVFGLSALPAASFPFMKNLYTAKSGDGSSCGSSSDSSSCSSGSSCCGGGGCGG